MMRELKGYKQDVNLGGLDSQWQCGNMDLTSQMIIL